MARLFIRIFMILIGSGLGSAIFPINFFNITNVVSWSKDTFKEGILYHELEANITNNKLENLFAEVEDIWKKFDIYSKKIIQLQNEKFKGNNKKTLDNAFLQNNKSILNELITIVDYYYNQALSLIKFKQQSINEPYINFLHAVLKGSRNLPTTLEKIYQLILSPSQLTKLGFIQLMITDAELNLPRECNKYISAQQSLLFIYDRVLISEMKGLITLSYARSIFPRQNKFSTYVDESIISKFEKRVKSYHQAFNKAMALLPKVIHRCEIYSPIKDDNFIQFVNYQRAILMGMRLPATNNHYRNISGVMCRNINHRSMDTEHLKFIHIYGCGQLGTGGDVEVCPAKAGTHRIYSWWKTYSQTYGHVHTCPYPIERGIGDPNLIDSPLCLCYTSDRIYNRYSDSIVRISTTSQISDIRSNMIVVGVKFVVHDMAVHLQIQQSKFIPGIIPHNVTEWKKLDDHKWNMNEQFTYGTLAEFSGQIYLDDVMLPPKYAVTGVRILNRSGFPEGFYLQVHGTKIDLHTGKLDPEGSTWFVAGDWDFYPVHDYKRPRMEIKVTDPDDPLRCYGYNYDRATNKFVQIIHSSPTKDAGQTTVPYIDAQPVQTHSSFPLSGVGLFYREKNGCGGYIAPRIFTIDPSHYM